MFSCRYFMGFNEIYDRSLGHTSWQDEYNIVAIMFLIVLYYSVCLFIYMLLYKIMSTQLTVNHQIQPSPAHQSWWSRAVPTGSDCPLAHYLRSPANHRWKRGSWYYKTLTCTHPPADSTHTGTPLAAVAAAAVSAPLFPYYYHTKSVA